MFKNKNIKKTCRTSLSCCNVLRQSECELDGGI